MSLILGAIAGYLGYNYLALLLNFDPGRRAVWYVAWLGCEVCLEGRPGVRWVSAIPTASPIQHSTMSEPSVMDIASAVPPQSGVALRHWGTCCWACCWTCGGHWYWCCYYFCHSSYFCNARNRCWYHCVLVPSFQCRRGFRCLFYGCGHLFFRCCRWHSLLWFQEGHWARFLCCLLFVPSPMQS